jgi:hypothetical protein
MALVEGSVFSKSRRIATKSPCNAASLVLSNRAGKSSAKASRTAAKREFPLCSKRGCDNKCKKAPVRG